MSQHERGENATKGHEDMSLGRVFSRIITELIWVFLLLLTVFEVSIHQSVLRHSF